MHTGLSRLHAIVDVRAAGNAGWNPADLARAFLDGGARLLQLRAKELASGVFLDLSDALVALTHEYDARVIVNDRLDVARLSGAAGVHVGQEDLPPASARTQLGPAAMLSIPTPDHYLPLLYVIATRRQGDNITFPVEGVDGGSISMLSVSVGRADAT